MFFYDDKKRTGSRMQRCSDVGINIGIGIGMSKRIVGSEGNRA